MTTTPVSPTADGSRQREPRQQEPQQHEPHGGEPRQQRPEQYEFVPAGFAHPDATDRIMARPRPSFAQSMGGRSTEFKNALIAGGVGIAVAFLAAGFGLGYWAGDAGSSTTPQSGFSQMSPGQSGGQMGSGQTGSGQAGGQFGGGSQSGGGQFGGTQNGVPGGGLGGQTQDGTGATTGSATGTGTTTS